MVIYMRYKKGFTLIELLIVISVIAFVIAFSGFDIAGVRENARDARRKSDLRQIQKALELYRQDKYPPEFPENGTFLGTPNTSCWSSGTPGINGEPIGTCTGNIYLQKVPGDPLKIPQVYYYYRNDDLGLGGKKLKYTLCTCIENTADADSIVGDCDAAYVCSSGRKYELHEP